MKYDLFPYSGSVTYIWDRYEEIASFLCSILTLLISPHLMGDKDSSQRHPFLCRPSYVIFLILVKSYVVLLRIHNLTLVQISTGITDPPPMNIPPDIGDNFNITVSGYLGSSHIHFTMVEYPPENHYDTASDTYSGIVGSSYVPKIMEESPFDKPHGNISINP